MVIDMKDMKDDGDWKNDNKEVKGIYYYNNDEWKGDRYEGY